MEDLDPSIQAKKQAGSELEKQRKEQQKQHDIAALEAQVYHLSELVGVSNWITTVQFFF